MKVLSHHLLDWLWVNIIFCLSKELFFSASVGNSHAVWWEDFNLPFSKGSPACIELLQLSRPHQPPPCPWKWALLAQPVGEGGSPKAKWQRHWAEAPPEPTLLTPEMVLRQVLLWSSRCSRKPRETESKTQVTHPVPCPLSLLHDFLAGVSKPVILFRCIETMQILWITIFFFTLINYHLYQWSIMWHYYTPLYSQEKWLFWFQQIHL